VVVVGQATQLDLVGIPAAADRRRPVAAQPGRGLQVGRVAQGLVPRPAARVVGDQLAVAERLDPVRVGADLDAAADRRGVHRVVVAVQPHVVVAGQPQRVGPAGHGRDRRQRQHRGTVRRDPVDRGAAQRTTLPAVGEGEPADQLVVEVRRRAEDPAGQERGLQVAVGPLDQALGLRVTRLADQHLGAQHPTKRVRLLGQDRLPPAPLPDRALAVPDQHPRHPAELGQELPPAREQVLRAPRRQQPGRQPARVAGHHHPAPAAATPTGPGRTPPAPPRRGTTGRTGRPPRPGRPSATPGPAAGTPGAAPPLGRAAPGSTLPADPLGDHRGRHRRPHPEQLTDPRLNLVHARPPRRPLILRRAVSSQRPLHRVPGDPHHPGDLLDRHLLGPAQPADLRPVLHAQHPASSPARHQARVVRFHPPEDGQLSPAGDRLPARRSTSTTRPVHASLEGHDHPLTTAEAPAAPPGPDRLTMRRRRVPRGRGYVD
jgi:hypothetical protein